MQSATRLARHRLPHGRMVYGRKAIFATLVIAASCSTVCSTSEAPEELLALAESTSEVSQKCTGALRKYLLCGAISSLFSVCHEQGLFNSSAELRKILDCKDDPSSCPENCMRAVSTVTNESVSAPCSADYQAMHGFTAPLNIFTLGNIDRETNATKATILPLPNIKGMTGPSFISYGEPAHCAEIPSAQYCVLSGRLGSLPNTRMRSSFALGTCLPKDCSEHELRSFVNSSDDLRKMGVSVQCDLVRPLGPAIGASAALEDKLGWGGVPVYYPNKIEFTTGAAITCAVIGMLALMVFVGTTIDVRRESKQKSLERARDAAREAAGTAGAPGAGGAPGREAAVPLTLDPAASADLPPLTLVEGFFNHWSLLRNGRSLLRTRPKAQNEFACMDAVRVFSMGQVILGHSFFYVVVSSGYANMEQFSPPHGLLGNFWFQIVPGCFYGVDSFFVMSGLLCAYGLQKKVFSRRENRRPVGFSLKYAQFALLRWLRLVPAEMFCIAFVVNVLPHLGSGILWNMERPGGSHCFEAAGSGQCGKYWWTNLLFIQDLDKYMGRCMGHTWYLANDFQLYLTAPFFALVYSVDRRFGWTLLAAGLLIGMVLPIALTVQHEWVPEIIAGSGSGFDKDFYMKPWCRCPAFLIGVATGWLWPSLQRRFSGGPRTALGRIVGLILSVVGVGLCCVATFGRMAFFQCDFVKCSDPDTSPVSKPLQYLWSALSIASWCVGLAIIMTLCFLRRFLPMAQGFMNLALWQPLAKLSYSAYLIHTSVLMLDFCQRDSPLEYTPSTFFFNFVSFTVCSLAAAFLVYILVEKPANNLQMKLFGAGGE